MNIHNNSRVGEVVVAYPPVRAVLERLGIDYCCGGDKPLGQAAAERGLGWEKVLADLEAAVNAAAEPGRDWSRAPLTDLADHIENRHHAFLRAQLPRIEGLFARVIPAHRLAHGELLEKLQGIFESLRQEIEQHLYKEEQILFPYIREMEAELRSGQGVPPMHCGSVENPIRQMMLEHENAGEALAKLAKETSNYALPPDSCQTYSALYDALRQLQDDLHEHIHLENNILFPRAIEAEQTGTLA